MRVIFSRKGFDSTAGGVPSPIIDGKPVSLPIPAHDRSHTRHRDLGLARLVKSVTRGKLDGKSLCHDDPMFADGDCWFGQSAAAQGHLAKNGVGIGDVFLFFGLFAEEETGEPHHRVFGYMQVLASGSPEEVRQQAAWQEPPRPHPHLCGKWDRNNALYFGPGRTASSAPPSLRLTRPDGPLNRWIVPSWMEQFGLTYHGKPERWAAPGELDSVKRGQEFICDIGDAQEPRAWLDRIIGEIDGRAR